MFPCWNEIKGLDVKDDSSAELLKKFVQASGEHWKVEEEQEDASASSDMKDDDNNNKQQQQQKKKAPWMELEKAGVPKVVKPASTETKMAIDVVDPTKATRIEDAAEAEAVVKVLPPPFLLFINRKNRHTRR